MFHRPEHSMRMTIEPRLGHFVQDARQQWYLAEVHAARPYLWPDVLQFCEAMVAGQCAADVLWLCCLADQAAHVERCGYQRVDARHDLAAPVPEAADHAIYGPVHLACDGSHVHCDLMPGTVMLRKRMQ